MMKHSPARRRAAWKLPLLGFAVALIAITLAARPAGAQDGADMLPDPATMELVESSIDRGLDYLARQQKPDGSWPSGFGKGDANANNAINALSLMAFLGRGHVPGRGPYQAVVDRGVAFIMSTQNDDGVYLSTGRSHGVMYEHGLATLAMVEAYGFLPREDMRKSIQKAVDLIVYAQNEQGGWRYHPRPHDADLSVTVMQVVALHSAQAARFDVPKEVLEKAVAYVRQCASPEGGFKYQPHQKPGDVGPARSAAGVLSLQLLGHFDDPAVKKGLDYILTKKPEKPNGYQHLYYTLYYSMQGFFQAGGDAWAQWHPMVRDMLLTNQREDGSWPGWRAAKYNGKEANCYSTAMAIITLNVYLHYLPAYQR